MGHLNFLFAFVLLVAGLAEGAPNCPCSNATLCNPITAGPRKELFVFQLAEDEWENYDWNYVTTMVVFGPFDPQMVCKAHANNARLVFATAISTTQLQNTTAVSEWILKQYQDVINNFADGINIDIEEPLALADAPQLNAVISNFTTFFHTKLPYSQITFDVAWSPNCIDLRCYDFAELARITDFVVMMDYDMRSQIFGPCVASANSPPALIHEAILNFTKLGIPSDKLVMGVPWYGYDYPCLNVSRDGKVCEIAKVPFRGVNCSDASGRERPFYELKKLLQNNSTTGYRWDASLESPWFNYFNQADNVMHQVWFDDPLSLSIKTTMARQMNLRGMSMWTGDFVDYQGDPASAAEFWETMEIFF